MDPERRIALFSMELALDPAMPTYAGGLGVLAGDLLQSAADLSVPAVAVSLVHRHGYFSQHLDPSEGQQELPLRWDPAEKCTELTARVVVKIAGQPVWLRIWRYDVVGAGGYQVPVFLLDSDVAPNPLAMRRLTDRLYGGDTRYRLAQEIILGVGGVRALRALGLGDLILHLNEGHASFAGLELLNEGLTEQQVRRRCLFTTHTPVPAGHDRFEYPLVRALMEPLIPEERLRRLAGEDALNMTALGLNLADRVNGVAARHEHTAEQMFPGHDLRHITNGVHSVRWSSPPFRALFDRHLPGWREDPSLLRKALAIPREELWAAHLVAREALFERVKAVTGRQLREGALTIGFARRATAYKRAELIFHDLERLRTLGRGRLQLVFAGKAHPHDEGGKEQILRVLAAGRALGDEVPVVFLPDYDVGLAAELVAGVDLWLNTPLRPLEASGTSGMKAAHNGVPSLSVLDGWWCEGWIEDVTGWSIGSEGGPTDPALAEVSDALDLYAKLERRILPLFLGNPDGWRQVMRSAIALNASFFNSHRVVEQYVALAYSAPLDAQVEAPEPAVTATPAARLAAPPPAPPPRR